MQTRVSLGLCGVLAAAMGCAEAEQQPVLKVVVGSDFAAMHEVRVRLFNGRGDPLGENIFRVAQNPPPFSFSVVVPQGGGDAPFLTFDAVVNDQTVFVRQARFSPNVADGETMFIYLSAQCESLQCEAEQTCTELGCASDFVSSENMQQSSQGDELGGLCEPGASWCTANGAAVERCVEFGKPSVATQCASDMVCSGTPSDCRVRQPGTEPPPDQMRIYGLRVFIRGGGQGSVFINDGADQCQGDCDYQISDGAQVKLRADPNPGSFFVGWRSDCQGGDIDCSLTINSDTLVEAQFELEGTDVMNWVTVSPQGSGIGRVVSDDGSLNCPDQNCDVEVLRGTVMTVRAYGENGSVFAGWVGPCATVQDGSCTFSVEANVELRPRFEPPNNGMTRFDINGDGFDDAVYGAPGVYAGTDEGAGAVYVRLGPIQQSSMGAIDAEYKWEGAEPFAELGHAIAAGSDITGDGIIDLVVSAPGTLGKTGAVYAIAGGPGLIGSQRLQGLPMSLFGYRAGELFGASLTTRPDLDGDGMADIVVGAPGDGSMAGRVYIYLTGSFGQVGPPTPDITLQGEQVGDRFGWSVESAGDLDGDGRDELIVGAPHFDQSPNPNVGRAYVYKFSTQLSSALDAEVVVTGSQPNAMLGFSVTGLGDWQGGPTAEWAVATHVQDTVYVFSGFDRTGMVGLTEAPWRLQAFGFFGAALGGFEDYTGDGRPDLVVGAPIAAGNSGQVRLYAGGGPTMAPTFQVDGNCVGQGICAEERLGYTVGPVGDLDNDGVVELGIGSRAGGGTMGPLEVGRILLYKVNDYTQPVTIQSDYSNWEIGGDSITRGLCATLSGSPAYWPGAAEPPRP